MILSYERQHYKTKCNSEDFGCKNSSVAPLFNIKIKICKTCQTFWIDSFFNLPIYSANSNSYFFLLSFFFFFLLSLFLKLCFQHLLVCTGVWGCVRVSVNMRGYALVCVSMQNCAWVCAGMLGSVLVVGVRLGLCECVQVCTGMHRCAQICASVRECTWECAGVHT